MGCGEEGLGCAKSMRDRVKSGMKSILACKIEVLQEEISQLKKFEEGLSADDSE